MRFPDLKPGFARWRSLLAGKVRHAPALLHADDDLRITSTGNPAAPNLLLCFTGVRQKMGGIGAEEFVGTAMRGGFSGIFVSDLRRSWFNGFAPERLQTILQDRTEGRRIVTLGNSMGGYGAIWATRHFRVDTAIAFAPQFSVHPDIVPGEARWMEFRRNILRYRHTSLADHFLPRTRYYTINGDADALHYQRFPIGENLEHVLLPGSGHEPARIVKEQRALNDAIAACIDGNALLPVLRDRGVPCRRMDHAAYA